MVVNIVVGIIFGLIVAGAVVPSYIAWLKQRERK